MPMHDTIARQARRLLGRLVVGGLVVLSVGATACNGAQQTNTPSGNQTIKATEYKFEPATIAADTGKDVNILLDNQGAIAHNWVVEGVNPSPQVQETAAKTKSKTLTFKAPAPGTYKILCNLPGHAEAGMVGQLTVK